MSPADLGPENARHPQSPGAAKAPPGLALDSPPAEDARASTVTLVELIARLERDSSPRDENYFRGPINSLGRELHESGETVPEQLVAEEIAFSVHAHDRQDASSWGLYFGPLMSWTTATGEACDTPPLAMMTAGVLAHWRRRASESPRPVMRARYADLLWEMPKRLATAKPDAAMACIAIDAYLEAVEGRRYEHDISAVGKAKRSLDVAVSLNDTARIVRARDVLLALEAAVEDDESLGLWGICFDTFVEPPNRRVPLSSAHRDELVAALEARLGRFAALPAGKYHPVGAEAAAIRLATHYRRQGRQSDLARVLRTYGDKVKEMRGSASPLLVAHSFEQLYDQFRAFGLRHDADALNELMRVAGEESLKDMRRFSTTVEVKREEVDAYLAELLSGSVHQVLLRIAVHFIPKRGELESQMRELAAQAPLSYMIPLSIKDDSGRTVAHVGSIDSDLEGRLLSHISQIMQFEVPWLREGMASGLEQPVFSAADLLAFVTASPLFPTRRRPMIERGLSAYVSGDSMTAIHLLVPQVEQAVRELATLVGAPIYAQRRGGGLHARTLDDLLRDAMVGEALGDNVITYLRVLLTDARGWNVRNSVCHGLAPASLFAMPVADRVVHAALVLALVRKDDSVPSDGSASP